MPTKMKLRDDGTQREFSMKASLSLLAVPDKSLLMFECLDTSG